MLKFILVYLLVFPFQLIAQSPSVLFEDLQFNSEFEQKQFHLVNQNENPLFELLLAPDPQMTVAIAREYCEKYESILSEISTKKYLNKSNDKKVKALYKDVHEALLDKYELQNRFSSIFLDGNYNCVSATALYALIFDELSIPYNIKEKPTHVYLLAFPETDQLLVESTDPSGNFFNYNDRFKTAVVGQLKDAKLISVDEYQSKTVDEIFNAFYYSDENIDLKELAGIQYLNDALYKLEESKTKEAYQQLKKSYFLYPKENIASMLVFLNVQLLNELKYSHEDAMDYLVQLSRLKGSGVTTENILAEFDHMTRLILTEKVDTLTYRKYYEEFLAKSTNKELNQEISYLYNIRKGLAHYTLGEHETAIMHTGKAYQIKPNNLEVNRALIGMISSQMASEGNNKKVVRQLSKYETNYPNLANNVMFKSMLADAYLIEFGQSYDFGEVEQAEKYRALFEKVYTDDLNINHSNLGRAYSLAAVHFFKRGQKNKARELLEQGLEYSPGNYELLTRKRMIR